MIEVEKKLRLTGSEQQELLEGASLLGEKIVEDTYFDADDYALTTRDIWLRRRDGAYELKVPLERRGAEATTNQYHEITDPHLIAEQLELPSLQDFEAALSTAGIKGFVTSVTHRNSYQKQEFHIDVDKVTFRDSDFTYALAEIELLVASEAEAGAAEQRIIEFMRGHQLALDEVVLGKIIAYLEVERPEHYAALKAANVF